MKQFNTSTWIHLVAITFMVVLFTGYQFNIYDQEDHLPQVYKLLSPELYANDFFVNEYFKTFNVRFFYVSLILLFGKEIGVYATVTIIHFISLFFAIYFTYKLSVKMGVSNAGALAASLLLPTVFNTFNLGLSNFTYSSCIAGSIAMPLCIFAFYSFFNKRFVLAGAAAGLACLFQVLMGLHIFILIGIASLFTMKSIGLKNILMYGMAFILFSAAMLAPIINQQFLADKIYDRDLVTLILAYIRNPHHYVPSYFPIINYIKFGSIVVLGIVAAKYLNKEATKSYYIMLIVSIVGMLVYYIGFEKLSINFIAATQWFKISVWICMFGVISLCAAIFRFSENSKVNELMNAYGSYFSFAIILFSGFILFNSAAIPIDKFQNKYHLGNYKKSDLTLLHEWINKNTNVNATFLIPPNDESFLCEAKRAAIVSYKPMIHQESYQVKWLEKMESIYNVSRSELTDGNAKNTLLVSYYKNILSFKMQNVDFIIAEKSRLSSSPIQTFSATFECGDWVLLKN